MIIDYIKIFIIICQIYLQLYPYHYIANFLKIFNIMPENKTF